MLEEVAFPLDLERQVGIPKTEKGIDEQRHQKPEPKGDLAAHCSYGAVEENSLGLLLVGREAVAAAPYSAFLNSVDI